MTHIIKILGTGCPKCRNLTKRTEETIAEHKIDATIEKVDDIVKIMEFDVISTPALVVDNKVVSTGRIPSKDEVLQLILTAKIS